MKIKLLTFSALLLTGYLLSQQGKATYVYTYFPKAFSQEDEEKIKIKTSETVMGQVKKLFSQSSSKYVIKFNNDIYLGQSLLRENFQNIGEFMLIGHGDFHTYPKENIIFQKKIFPNEGYIMRHSYEQLKWQITDEVKQIGYYKCTKATSSMRSQNPYMGRLNEIEAWFTEDTPYKIAPWYYYGLPGMVVSVRQGVHQFVLDKVEETEVDIKVNIDKDKAISNDEYIAIKGKKETIYE